MHRQDERGAFVVGHIEFLRPYVKDIFRCPRPLIQSYLTLDSGANDSRAEAPHPLLYSNRNRGISSIAIQ